MLAVFIPPLGPQAAFLISQEQAGFPSSVPLHMPDAGSSCLFPHLGARENKGFFSYICLTPVCLSFSFHEAGPNCPQIQKVTRTPPSMLECLILCIDKVKHTYITEKKTKIQRGQVACPTHRTWEK